MNLTHLLLVLAFAPAGGDTPTDPITCVIETRALPGARAAHATVDAHGDVHVAFGTDAKIHVASSHDGGRTVQAPVVVASGRTFALGMRRGPRVAATSSTLCIAAIGGEEGGGKDGDVLAWTSRDGGRTWGEGVRVNDEAGSAREGLFALAAGPKATLFCTWLDLRHAKTELFGAVSEDGGAKWSASTLVYRSPSGSICECCAPSVAFDAGGTLYVMWRNQIDGFRDLWFIESKDAGRTFGAARKLGEGSWKLAGCPMDGGGLCTGGGDSFDSVWRRESEIYRVHFPAQELLLGAGMQPTIARGDAGTFIAWIEKRGGALRLLEPASETPREMATSANDPTLVSRWNGTGLVYLVWENERGIYCSTVRGAAHSEK